MRTGIKAAQRCIRSRSCPAAVAFALATALLPGLAGGGGWHVNERLACSDCHTMHNSSKGLPMRYDGLPDGAPKLLRAGTPTRLCQACHDGSNPSAPNVMNPTLGDPPGGGFPLDAADPLSHAHQLTGASLQPPDGDVPVVMGCTACHDPHGSQLYRNLKPSPSGTGRAWATPVVALERLPAGSATVDLVYSSSNVTYVTGMSQWCMDCHNNFDTLNTYFHSYDRPIYGGVGTDYAWWSTGVFPSRAPVQTPSYLAGSPTPAVPSQDNRVTCLSCHKAHGSTFKGSMLDVGDPLDATSLCNQCHNK